MPWPSVLVVDDDSGTVETLSDILQTRGYYVTGAYSGEEAVAMVRADGYHVVLMDVRMPGLSGVEALRAIKAVAPQMQVILMTAFSNKQTVEEAEGLGALAVLPKPLDMERVLILLEGATRTGKGPQARAQ